MSTTLIPEAPSTPSSDEALEAFADKIFTDLLGTLSTFATSIGVELGWYDALAATESMNPAEPAAATSTDARYAREWLEQQTVSGYLTVVDAGADADERRFTIVPEAAV